MNFHQFFLEKILNSKAVLTEPQHISCKILQKIFRKFPIWYIFCSHFPTPLYLLSLARTISHLIDVLCLLPPASTLLSIMHHNSGRMLMRKSLTSITIRSKLRWILRVMAEEREPQKDPEMFCLETNNCHLPQRI